MIRRLAVFLPVLLLVLSACQILGGPKPAPGVDPANASTPSNPADPAAPQGSGPFAQPGNPIDVSLTLAGAGVTQVIPAAGGSLSAAGADGTKYTLTIPAGALRVDTEISLTPVSAISGLPFAGGLGGAVKLEPNGLAFDQFVTLKIEPATAIPLANQVLFGFEGDGEDLHLAIPGADSSVVEIQLLHFSGAGLANGTSDEKAAVYKRMADRVELRLTNEMGDYLQNLRQGQNLDPEVMQQLFTEYYNSVVVPRLKAATSPSATCADATKAIQTFFGWERQRQLLGASQGEDKKFQEMVSSMVPLLAKKCFDEEYNRCANKHEIAGMIPALLGYERQGELLGAFDAAEPQNDNQAWAETRSYGLALMRKCFQWDLVFESAGNFTDGIDGYDSSVSAKIPIRPEGGDSVFVTLTGKSALVNKSFTFKDNAEDCDITSNRGGGEFKVEALSWENVLKTDPDGVERFYVKDFSLSYYPGDTSESITLECWNPDPPHERYPKMNTPPSPLWTGTFIMNHYKEAAKGGDGAPPTPLSPGSILEGAAPEGAKVESYLAKAWKVSPSQRMGTKTWSGNSELDPAVFEGGDFELVHTPQ